MKKIEFVWRHLLNERLTHHQNSFRQQDLADLLGLSSSTVNLALRPLRATGAVRISKRGFEIADLEKILFHWANHHQLVPQLHLHLPLPPQEIEGQLPDGSVTTAYSAVREIFTEPPADYDKVYCYHPQPEIVIARFQTLTTPAPPNLFVLSSDPLLAGYGPQITLGHLFVDLWNLPDWYAKDFVHFIKVKIDELLS